VCGVVGILTTRPGAVSAPRLVKMRDAMVHRGPDGCGLWHDAERRVGLAHRRLSIIDLSEAGRQPMGSPDGNVWLTFNGEIYNHLELRRELEARGHRFLSRSDTEAILLGYLEWGDGVVERLEGMFAFAVWDARRGEALLVRDRIGVKPLYFCETAGEFLFASEIKALLADPHVPREVEPIAAWHYLTFFVPPAPLTMFRGIYKLPAGHLLRVRPGQGPRLERWWDPVAAPPTDMDPDLYRDDATSAAELIRRLDSSVERRMMSDVPFGVFLSGGVDSSTNVALMSRHMDRPVDTFSVGFKGHEEYNEFEYARLVATRFKTNHHEVSIDEDDMLEFLPQLVHQQDEPIADWVCVPLHFVSKLARDNGTIVVQVGEGADEQFCGYPQFQEPLAYHAHYQKPLDMLPAALRGLPVAGARLLGLLDPRWRARAEIAADVVRGGELFWGGAICYRGQDKQAVWAAGQTVNGSLPDFVPAAYAQYDSEQVVREIAGRFRRENPRAGFYEAMIYLELRLRLPELLLMRVDKISMTSSVEARVPFLDHHVVEFSMGMPMDQRLRGGVGKYLLKQAVRGLLPDEVIDRPKMGFGAPVAEWMRGPFGEYTRDRLMANRTGLFDKPRLATMLDEHRSGKKFWAVHLWLALNLTLWHDHWIVGKES
jgi:asparagine synthase (glutamine-hydrolysing)